MSAKKFEVEIEIVKIQEVIVWADNFEDAACKANCLSADEVLEEGTCNDHEMRVIGVRRNKNSRMYK